MPASVFPEVSWSGALSNALSPERASPQPNQSPPAAVGAVSCGLLRPGAAGACEDVRSAGALLPRRVPKRCADQGRLAGECHRAAELVVRGADGELGLLRPGAPGAHEDEGGAGAHVRRGVAERCADQGRLAGEGDRRPELVDGVGVGGAQLLLHRPGPAGAREDVGRAGALQPCGGMPRRADQRRLAEEGDALAELIVDGGVGGGQHLLLRPGTAGAGEDVDGAGVCLPRRVAAVRADQRRLAEERDGLTEEVVFGASRGSQRGLRGPGSAGQGEDVDGAGAHLSRDLVDRRSDQRRVTRERDRGAKLVVGGAIGGGQQDRCRPDAGRAGEDVGLAGEGLARGLVPGRTNQRRLARKGDGPAELVPGAAVGGVQFGLPQRQPRPRSLV